ncbi:MAG: helicase C-terminal domain-containing protein, partial [Anaerolineales bacterium]
RSNYLCPRRVEMMRHFGPRDADELRTLAKVLVWQLESDSGDRNEINLTRPAEKDAWMRLSAEDDACTAENCAGRMGGACPFYRAKQAALNAHILIVNHALLLSDVATGSRVLPDYQYLIVDEAHHLEAATTNALSFRFTQTDMERMLREMGGPTTGILGSLLSITRNLIRPSDFAQLSQLVHRAADLGFRLDSMAKDFFFALGEFIKFQREGQPQSMYSIQVRILPATRTQMGWDNIEIAWESAGETLRLLINNLSEVYKAITEIYADGNPEVEDALGSLSNLYRRMTEAEANISAMIHEPAPNLVYWIEVNAGNNRLALNAAPLRVGPLIQKYLWHEKSSVILTSATLTTHGEFDYIRNALSADEADTLMLGSPFDYESAALLYIPRDMPEPTNRDYESAINRTLIQLCAAVGGRTLVLFTSYAHLKRTAQAISGPLAEYDVTVYEQGEGASANALLDAFKTTERAVLLGTRSFWEGVDVPGESLQVVVITKLPFDVPSDPLVAARSETFEDPFGEYQIPEAILRFRQGFGRLIRSAQDRGVVAVLDKRVLTKAYGNLFLQSLPQCTVRQGSLGDLPKLAARWLNL